MKLYLVSYCTLYFTGLTELDCARQGSSRITFAVDGVINRSIINLPVTYIHYVGIPEECNSLPVAQLNEWNFYEPSRREGTKRGTGLHIIVVINRRDSRRDIVKSVSWMHLLNFWSSTFSRRPSRSTCLLTLRETFLNFRLLSGWIHKYAENWWLFSYANTKLTNDYFNQYIIFIPFLIFLYHFLIIVRFCSLWTYHDLLFRIP